MKTLQSIIAITFAILALTSAAFAEPQGKGGSELTTKTQFAELKSGDKVILTCTMCKTHAVIDIKDSKAAMELCKEGNIVHCPTCKKNFKVTWGHPAGKTGGPNTMMTIVDETGKPCMVYSKA